MWFVLGWFGAKGRAGMQLEAGALSQGWDTALMKNDMEVIFFPFSPARPIYDLSADPLCPILNSFSCRKRVSKPHFSCLVEFF